LDGWTASEIKEIKKEPNFPAPETGSNDISREFLQISLDIMSRYRIGTCGTTARGNPF
jgi:hypothetical protein